MIAQGARETYDDFDSRIADTALDAAYVGASGLACSAKFSRESPRSVRTLATFRPKAANVLSRFGMTDCLLKDGVSLWTIVYNRAIGSWSGNATFLRVL